MPGDPFAGAILYVWDKTVQPAIDQQWNLTVQSEVSPTTTFQVALCRSARDPLDGSHAISARNAQRMG